MATRQFFPGIQPLVTQPPHATRLAPPFQFSRYTLMVRYPPHLVVLSPLQVNVHSVDKPCLSNSSPHQHCITTGNLQAEKKREQEGRISMGNARDAHPFMLRMLCAKGTTRLASEIQVNISTVLECCRSISYMIFRRKCCSGAISKRPLKNNLTTVRTPTSPVLGIPLGRGRYYPKSNVKLHL